MFYELVVRKVLLVTLYNKQTFLAAKIENKTPIKQNRMLMLNSERKTAFTASHLLTFTVVENVTRIPVTPPAVVKCKYRQSDYRNLFNSFGAFLFFQR